MKTTPLEMVCPVTATLVMSSLQTRIAFFLAVLHTLITLFLKYFLCVRAGLGVCECVNMCPCTTEYQNIRSKQSEDILAGLHGFKVVAWGQELGNTLAL